MASTAKTSAELEAEVEQQRRQLETRVSEIQARLSPGQLVDEMLSYAKASGGGDFLANLGRNVQANPLPVALTGVGLAWLMARSAALPPGQNADSTLVEGRQSRDSLPYARISGSALRQAGHLTDEAGQHYTEFVDGAGTRFKAMTDALGNRTGHFTDQAGTTYRGFTDQAGNLIGDFLDEAGNRLSDAQGWAGDAWDSAQDRLSQVQQTVANGAGQLRRRAAGATGQLQRRAGDMGHTVGGMLRDQPLIEAALAFAVGAAVAAALPPTEQEDALIGKTADEVKARGARLANDAYQQGKQQVADTYEDAREQTAATYDKVRDELIEGQVPGS